MDIVLSDDCKHDKEDVLTEVKDLLNRNALKIA